MNWSEGNCMQRLWVYKCNSKDLPHQASYGNWDDFFDDPGDGSWGGTWGIKNAASVKFLREEIGRDDLVLAYQTDRRKAVGLCRVKKLVKHGEGEVDIYLTPVKRLVPPVDILKLKRRVAAIANGRAFQQGCIQTIFKTTAKEAAAILHACGMTVGT